MTVQAMFFVLCSTRYLAPIFEDSSCIVSLSGEMFSSGVFPMFSTKPLRIQQHVSLFTACLLLVSPHPKPKSGEKPETCPQSLHFFCVADGFSTVLPYM